MAETYMKTLERLKDHFSHAQYVSLKGKIKEERKSILAVLQTFASDDASLLVALEELVEHLPSKACEEHDIEYEANMNAFMEDLNGKLADVPDEHWVLYIDGKLVEISEDPEQLVDKIDKDCLMVQKGNPFPEVFVG